MNPEPGASIVIPASAQSIGPASTDVSFASNAASPASDASGPTSLAASLADASIAVDVSLPLSLLEPSLAPSRAPPFSLSGASGQAQAWLRFERPASPTEFDIDVPSRASLVTEDGAFTAGRWHVLVRNDAGGEGVRFTLACQ